AQQVQQAIGLAQQAKEAQNPVRPRKDALAEVPRIKINNGKISGTISLYGPRIDDVALDEYYEEIDKKDNVVVLSPKDTEFPRHVSHGWITDEADTGKIKIPDDTSLWHTEGNDKLSTGNPVTLAWDNGQGLKFENIYEIDDNYIITLTQKVTNNSG